ncbi:MAG: YbdK family carboxylate-amine ligase, partial [Myxococcales bacterium]|nr:YbdK family carboxylate-amine ligase [Myxococcales bacterium]
MANLPFKENPSYSIGVEEEYQICDPKSGALLPLMPEFMKHVPEGMESRFSYELLQTVVESNTTVCETVDCAIKEMADQRRATNEVLRTMGARIGMGSTHPFARWQDQKFVDTESYKWVGDQLRVVAQRNLTFGLHVHVGVGSAEGAIHTCNSIRRWYGPLLAMSANSPFFEGVDTGFQSFRTQLFGAFPRSGVPPHFRDYDHFAEIIGNLIEAKSITKPRQVWWGVRPHPTFGTVELRFFDEQHSIERLAGIVAISQALVASYMDEHGRGDTKHPLEREYIEDGRWKAMRFGLDCHVIDPRTR